MENEFWKNSPFGENSIFHPNYDENLRLKANTKSLTLKYQNCDSAENNIFLNFEVTASGLSVFDAEIGVKEIDVWDNATLIPKTKVTINPNGTKTVRVSYDKKRTKGWSKTIFEGDFDFVATITCDGLSAKTEEFRIDCKAKAINSNVSILPSCYCNRDFTITEFKEIVLQLRKKEIYLPKSRLVKDSTGKPVLKEGKRQFVDITQFDQLGEKLFSLDYPEKINSSEANFTSFCNAINKALKKYEINTCIRKIHFLAQCYHETQRFTLTYEKSPRSTYSGGAFYGGRGLIQLTHDYNYTRLQTSLNNTQKLIDFVPRVSKEIELACDASGYFWKNIGAKKGNISQFADLDDVLIVSQEINGYVATPNGFNDRKLFTNLLKDIMNYAKCKSKK